MREALQTAGVAVVRIRFPGCLASEPSLHSYQRRVVQRHMQGPGSGAPRRTHLEEQEDLEPAPKDLKFGVPHDRRGSGAQAVKSLVQLRSVKTERTRHVETVRRLSVSEVFALSLHHKLSGQSGWISFIEYPPRFLIEFSSMRCSNHQ